MPRANDNTGVYVMFLLLLHAGFSAAKQVGYAFMANNEHKPFAVVTSSNDVTPLNIALDAAHGCNVSQVLRDPNDGHVFFMSMINGTGSVIKFLVAYGHAHGSGEVTMPAGAHCLENAYQQHGYEIKDDQTQAWHQFANIFRIGIPVALGCVAVCALTILCLKASLDRHNKYMGSKKQNSGDEQKTPLTMEMAETPTGVEPSTTPGASPRSG